MQARQRRHTPTLDGKPLTQTQHSCSAAHWPETLLRLTSQRAQRAVFGLPTWRAAPRTPMKPSLGASRSSRGASHSHEVARAAHAARGVSGAGQSTRAQFSATDHSTDPPRCSGIVPVQKISTLAGLAPQVSPLKAPGQTHRRGAPPYGLPCAHAQQTATTAAATSELMLAPSPPSSQYIRDMEEDLEKEHRSDTPTHAWPST